LQRIFIRELKGTRRRWIINCWDVNVSVKLIRDVFHDFYLTNKIAIAPIFLFYYLSHTDEYIKWNQWSLIANQKEENYRNSIAKNQICWKDFNLSTSNFSDKINELNFLQINLSRSVEVDLQFWFADGNLIGQAEIFH